MFWVVVCWALVRFLSEIYKLFALCSNLVAYLLPLFFIGFCGGFTTFCSYIMDIYQQFLAYAFMKAWLLLALHLILSLVSAGLGIWLAWRISNLLV